MALKKRGAMRASIGTAAAATALLSLVACSGGSSDGGPSGSAGGEGTTFTVLQYENPDTAQGQGWQLALEIFKEKHPDVTVDYQTTSSEVTRSSSHPHHNSQTRK